MHSWLAMMHLSVWSWLLASHDASIFLVLAHFARETSQKNAFLASNDASICLVLAHFAREFCPKLAVLASNDASLLHDLAMT